MSHVRNALLDSLGKLGTNATLFLPDVRAVIAEGPTPISAKVAWQILNDAEPSRQLFDKLVKRMDNWPMTAEAVNNFAVTALVDKRWPMERPIPRRGKIFIV